ncbi:MAG: HD-GYP domain-containing protein [Treponema sp.]|nr:HD-GYP domain-containing protein [Treponema sp.]
MNSFNVTELSDRSVFSNELLLDETFLLLTPQSPFNDKLKQSLLNWEFRQVYSESEQGQVDPPELPKPTTSSASVDVAIEEAFMEDVTDDEIEETKETKDSSVMERALKRVENSKTESTSTDKNHMILVQIVYEEYIDYIEEIYTKFTTHKTLDYDSIAAELKDLCVFINEQRRYILRLQPENQVDSRTYLLNHAMRSTIFAITIALQLRMPFAKQVDLAVACVLHEIGMLQLPPQLYVTSKPLSLADRNSIYTHPILSYNVLKNYNFPLSIQLGALEHHEKQNGTGYPRKLTGEKISLFAKIIAVACSFEAITAPRLHKVQQSSYEAMVELLKNNSLQFDENVIKALLFAVSLYPIGAYVFLHNGKIGQVVDVNPLNPKLPVVQILGEKDEHGDPISISVGNDVRIVRTLSRQEVLDLQKVVENKKAK